MKPTLATLIFTFIFILYAGCQEPNHVVIGSTDENDTDDDTGTEYTIIDIDLTWNPIPGGTFEMGSIDGNLDELPIHTVTVPDFEMTKTEVTNAQYAEFLNVNGNVCNGNKCVIIENSSLRLSESDGVWSIADGYDDHPVIEVTWYGAKVFCERVGGRLASESEWEYAGVSAGEDINYPWISNWRPSCNLAVMANIDGSGCGTEDTWPVCSKAVVAGQPEQTGNTEQGLCDMVGNASEWVADPFHSDYTGATTDGSVWTLEGDENYRITRGGSWRFTGFLLRSSFRYWIPPDIAYNFTGVRCARSSN